MDKLPFLAFLAPLLLFWQQSKNFLLKIFRIFWKERNILYDIHVPFYDKLRKNCKIFSLDDYELARRIQFNAKGDTFDPVYFKFFHFQIALYKNFIPIFIFGTKDRSGFKIQYLKYSIPFEEWLEETIREHNDDEGNRYQSRLGFYTQEYRGKSLKTLHTIGHSIGKDIDTAQTPQKYPILGNYGIIKLRLPQTIGVNINDIEIEKPSDKKDKYIFTQEGEIIKNKVESWLNAEEWYHSKNIRYYRGILLHGEPGTGKSSLPYQIARKLNIPLFVFDLSSFDNEEFGQTLEDLPVDSCIILFEDIDNVWDKRESKNKVQNFVSLTFDYFINKLSGAKAIKNKFVFITTNNKEKVDPALLRAGRVDEQYELKSLNKEEKLKMAKIILDNDDNLVNHVVDMGIYDTTAEFENRLTKIALDNFWENK